MSFCGSGKKYKKRCLPKYGQTNPTEVRPPFTSMAIEKVKLVNNEIYHIVLRGVGDMSIFKDESDYYRAIFSIYEFNTIKPIEIRLQREKRQTIKKHGGLTSDTRDPLVEILVFCFIPNHIHLLVRQLKDKGISKFMQKVGTGYAVYFNKKYNWKGHLFQGRFRAVRIKDDAQLFAIFAYIHMNPASLIESKWKEKGIKNFQRVIKFLENYKWSSYQDYIGKKNFPSVTKREFLLETMNGAKGCKEFMKNWVRYKEKRGNFDDISLE